MEIEFTADGSHTLRDAQFGENYHSKRGALLESLHVFVDAGFNYFSDRRNLRILEIGFGTGLNALLAMLEARKREINLCFETVEAFPVAEEIVAQLNYANLLGCDVNDFIRLHQVSWNEMHRFENFSFRKHYLDVVEYLRDAPEKTFDIIYYDAFSPTVQPELWTRELFSALHKTLTDGGILLTYSSKGTVKQALRDAGFNVKRLPGAGGKHHMVRAESITLFP